MKFRILHALKKILIIASSISLLASTVSLYQNYDLHATYSSQSLLNGLLDGLIIATFLSSYTFIVVEIFLRTWFKKRRFYSAILLNSSMYTLLILIGRALGRFIMEADDFQLLPIQNEIDRKHLMQALGFGLLLSILINFFYELSKLLAPGILANFITGRYHKPRQEKRIVMFLDLASSTSIAEQIGDVEYLSFLDDFFSDFTEGIIKTGAQIYKYVGDEIILTWSDTGSDMVALKTWQLLEALQNRLSNRKVYYKNRYGIVPFFRAGVHQGSLVTGEMGELKKEIVHVGDLMNTTARIAGHCRTAQVSVLYSATVFKRLSNLSDVNGSSIGRIQLRGKSQDLELVSPALESAHLIKLVPDAHTD